MDNLYNFIEGIAKKNGFRNITEFCKVTGIPRATMSELKAGRTKKLSAKTAQIIFNTLQIPIELLLGIEPLVIEESTNKPAVSDGLAKKDARLLEWFRSLPEEKQKAILALGGAPEDLTE